MKANIPKRFNAFKTELSIHLLSRIVDVVVHADESDVVVQVSGEVVLVNENIRNVELDVSVELGIVVNVPLA